ncbi:MAG: peptidylprolyl isomerase, partial [Magnetococcales bacterium]|nr:peptidylprolyl isomerase [Magnetococcales bacterium]
HYREDLRDQIIQSRLMVKVIRPMINVSDEEIKEVYQATGGKNRSEEIHLAQILLTIEPGSKPEKVQAVRDLAQRLIRELKGGANLASLASQYSDDSSGLKGGDLGWFKRGQLQPEIERQIFNLPPGSVAGPIPTSQGIHILQVMERRNSSSPETMQQVKVRHILITVPRKALPEEEEQALQKIEKIRHEIEKGLPFDEGAKKYSQDSSNKEGGDLGWVGRGLMVPEFEQVIFSLEPGVLSKPVRTAFGWHLIKVEKRRTQDASSLSAMRNELEKRVLDAKSQIKFRQWLRDLRLRAFVELR